MPYKLMLAVLQCLQSFHISGQTTPLNIGDKITETKFYYLLNNTKHAGNLPDKRYKITILDFWATWCSSCIKVFPKIEKLQQEFSNEVQFLLVNAKSTMDDSVKTRQFFSKWKTRYGKALSLRSVEQDTIFDALFVHNIVPHYVWLNDAGEVLAFTSADEVTAEHIQKMLKGNAAGITIKKDQDKRRPLFTNPDIPLSQLMTYKIFIKGGFEGLGSGNRLHYTGDTLRGRAITNMGLRDMYMAILRELYPDFTENRFVTDMAYTDSALLPAPTEENARNGWQRKYMNSLEVILPPSDAAQLYCTMLEELNHSSGYYGRMEWRKVPCFVLRSTGRNKSLASKGGETETRLFNMQNAYLKNADIRFVTMRLNNCPAVSIPVVDESRINTPIDISFPEGFENIELIQKRLEHYGLMLEKTERNLEVLVMRKTDR